MLQVMDAKGITANVDNEWDGNGIGRVSLRKPDNFLTLAVSPGAGDALKTPDITSSFMEEIRSMSNGTMRGVKYSRPSNVTHACRHKPDPSWIQRLTGVTKSWLKYFRGNEVN